MRKVLLVQEDISLFEQPMCPEHYDYFIENMEDIIKMLKEQNHGFWLRYVISHRSSCYSRGLIPRTDWRKVFAEEAYIDSLKLLTSDEKKRTQNVIRLAEDLRFVYKFNYYITDAGLPIEFCLLLPEFHPTFQRLFGTVEDMGRKFIKFIVWTRFFGGLVTIHKHWKKAKSVNSISEIPWKAPIQWFKMSKIHRVHMFEKYLKETWGENLSQLVDFKSPIAWWDKVEDVTTMQTIVLSTVFPTQVGILGLILGPPESDDEEEEGDGAAGAGVDTAGASVGATGGNPDNSRLVDINNLLFMMNLNGPELCVAKTKFVVCANCKVPEPVQETYKHCKRCSEEKFPILKYYCGKECQVEDWHKIHKHEHKVVEKYTRISKIKF